MKLETIKLEVHTISICEACYFGKYFLAGSIITFHYFLWKTEKNIHITGWYGGMPYFIWQLSNMESYNSEKTFMFNEY